MPLVLALHMLLLMRVRAIRIQNVLDIAILLLLRRLLQAAGIRVVDTSSVRY